MYNKQVMMNDASLLPISHFSLAGAKYQLVL